MSADGWPDRARDAGDWIFVDAFLPIASDEVRKKRHGVAAAYARYRVRLWRDAVRDVLAAWLGAPTEEQLRQQLDAEHVLLLSDEAQVQVESWLAIDPGRPDRLWRTGLLTLCRLDGVDPAFAMLNMTDAAPRPAIRTRPSEHRPRDLAVARLRSGREPDNPDAAFVHAELALLAGRDDEADAAIARCAEHSTSWNRRNRARLLTDWMEQCPELAAGWARLRSTIAAHARDLAISRSTAAATEHGDSARSAGVTRS